MSSPPRKCADGQPVDRNWEDMKMINRFLPVPALSGWAILVLDLGIAWLSQFDCQAVNREDWLTARFGDDDLCVSRRSDHRTPVRQL